MLGFKQVLLGMDGKVLETGFIYKSVNCTINRKFLRKLIYIFSLLSGQKKVRLAPCFYLLNMWEKECLGCTFFSQYTSRFNDNKEIQGRKSIDMWNDYVVQNCIINMENNRKA